MPDKTKKKKISEKEEAIDEEGQREKWKKNRWGEREKRGGREKVENGNEKKKKESK